jgi:hypothetical protein
MISDDAVSEIAAFGARRHPIPTVRKSACALLRRLARTSGKVGYGQFEPFDRLAGGRRIAAAGLPRRQPFWGVRSWVGAPFGASGLGLERWSRVLVPNVGPPQCPIVAIFTLGSIASR